MATFHKSNLFAKKSEIPKTHCTSVLPRLGPDRLRPRLRQPQAGDFRAHDRGGGGQEALLHDDAGHNGGHGHRQDKDDLLL